MRNPLIAFRANGALLDRLKARTPDALDGRLTRTARRDLNRYYSLIEGALLQSVVVEFNQSELIALLEFVADGEFLTVEDFVAVLRKHRHEAVLGRAYLIVNRLNDVQIAALLDILERGGVA